MPTKVRDPVRDAAVHAQKPTFGIDQRSARRAGVHRRVMLDHPQGCGRISLPVGGRNDPCGHRQVQPQGRAQGPDLLPQAGGRPGDQPRPGGRDRDDRHVARLVHGQDAAGLLLSRGIGQADLGGLAHDMRIGHGHRAVPAPEEGRAQEAVGVVGGPHGQHRGHRPVQHARRGFRGAGGGKGQADQRQQHQDQPTGQKGRRLGRGRGTGHGLLLRLWNLGPG